MSEKIAVVFGGPSNENEISVITGAMAANVLSAAGKDVLPVYISQEGIFYAGAGLAELATYKKDSLEKFPRAVFGDGGVYLFRGRRRPKHIFIDCVLNCCHGGWGEGGGLSGVCAAAGLPLAGAGIFESSAFMDKYLTKILLTGLGVTVAPFIYFDGSENSNICGGEDGNAFGGGKQSNISGGKQSNIFYDKDGNIRGFPLVVKPCRLGSSIGVEKVENAEELSAALRAAFILDGAAIAEPYFGERREINCAAYRSLQGVCVSECEEAISGGELLSFEDKYRGGGRSVMPADIPEEIAAEIRGTTALVYSKLNMRGIVRFDYIWAEKVYLSEVNTVPGSLAYYLFSKSFKDFSKVLSELIAEAEEYFEKSHKKLIKTGILANLPSNACKIPRK